MLHEPGTEPTYVYIELPEPPSDCKQILVQLWSKHVAELFWQISFDHIEQFLQISSDHVDSVAFSSDRVTISPLCPVLLPSFGVLVCDQGCYVACHHGVFVLGVLGVDI